VCSEGSIQGQNLLYSRNCELVVITSIAKLKVPRES
jgi:hypothetical protein